MCQCQTHRRGRWLWWQRGQRSQLTWRMMRTTIDNEEEEAEVAFAVLLEQGKEVAAEASRASSSI